MAVRVLIVDDDVVFRDAIADALTTLGYEVVGHAGTLADARSAIRERRPDAVLLDVNLPDGSGLAFVEAAPDDGVRVLLTSSDPDAASARSVRRSGAVGFVAKTALLMTDLRPYLG
jgi:DNA-binding NarL/FixJ family response regulator